MSEPVTKAEWATRHRELSREQAASIEVAKQEVLARYRPLFARATELFLAAPHVAPVKNEIRVPPPEKANWAPPQMKIEFAHPCAGDKCMNDPCCEDPS